VDQTIFIVAVVVLLPVGIIWALAKTASLRGPGSPAGESHRRVESLVTEAIPEDPAEDDDEAYEPPPYVPPA
jgi:hypothetical protein